METEKPYIHTQSEQQNTTGWMVEVDTVLLAQRIQKLEIPGRRLSNLRINILYKNLPITILARIGGGFYFGTVVANNVIIHAGEISKYIEIRRTVFERALEGMSTPFDFKNSVYRWIANRLAESMHPKINDPHEPLSMDVLPIQFVWEYGNLARKKEAIEQGREFFEGLMVRSMEHLLEEATVHELFHYKTEPWALIKNQIFISMCTVGVLMGDLLLRKVSRHFLEQAHVPLPRVWSDALFLVALILAETQIIKTSRRLFAREPSAYEAGRMHAELLRGVFKVRPKERGWKG